jgi:hypothetical protein
VHPNRVLEEGSWEVKDIIEPAFFSINGTPIVVNNSVSLLRFMTRITSLKIGQ